MPVIGISGSYGGMNTGDEAIFTCVVGELRSRVPDVEIVVFSRNAEHTRQHHAVERVVDAKQATREEVLPEVERLDLLILGGGGILFDQLVHAFLREVRIAQQLGIPTFAYAVGAGPLEGVEERQAVREVLSRMDVVTVREIEAKKLLEEIGVDKEIVLTADPALLLTPEPFTDEMLSKEGVNAARSLVGFSVREPGGAAPGLDESAYHKLLADAADYIIHRFDADIVFVPMERGRDIGHAHQVIAQMTKPDRASVLKGDYRPAEVLGLTGRFEMAVGMRLHFLIFAAISSVPFLALPYSGKVASLLKALGLPEQSLVQEGRAGPLLATVDELWDNRSRHRSFLKEQVPELQKLARRTADMAVGLLEGTGVSAPVTPQQETG